MSAPVAEVPAATGEGAPPVDPKEPRHRFKLRRPAPRRDPKLYDYP